MNDATVIVLAKAPVPGRVKTRLCPPCTEEQAAEIARAAIADTLTAVLATPAVRPVVVLDGDPGPWLPAGLDVIPQRSGDLGARLAGAFAGNAGPTVLIGMDTPQVTPEMLRLAVAHLLAPRTDAVLGPTVDGGWWIIGLKRPRDDIFRGVPMSTETTGDRQVERLHELGLATHILPVEVDVDTFADARAVARAVPHTEFARAVHRVTHELATGIRACW